MTLPANSADSPAASASVTPTAARSSRPRHSLWPVFLAADLVVVLVFAALGRTSHGEGLLGTLSTALPFLCGTVAGWLLARGARRPAAIVPTGLVVWLATEIVGMVLRWLTGAGTAWSFVVVSTVVLAVFLVGYRAIIALVSRVADRRRESRG